MHMKSLKNTIIIALMLMTVVACNMDKNHPGYIYFPDMTYSQASETYATNDVFENGFAMRLPVDGTIPRGYTPYPYKAKSFQDQVNAGLELVNPLQPTPENITEGKRQFEIFCMNCHGVLGKGDGHLYTSKLFPAKPTSLVEAFVQGKPDGEIYHVITMGSLSGLMGQHGSQILPENRWKIIHYVRALAK
ncbi:MAG: cytochrome C [Bacteroidetes bacterium HGW-Bacteroidetes-1]|nr:MAG: cytochrome C [Bacteroidetes bacterium HGW-Bacteroidetes-1]